MTTMVTIILQDAKQTEVKRASVPRRDIEDCNVVEYDDIHFHYVHSTHSLAVGMREIIFRIPPPAEEPKIYKLEG